MNYGQNHTQESETKLDYILPLPCFKKTTSFGNCTWENLGHPGIGTIDAIGQGPVSVGSIGWWQIHTHSPFLVPKMCSKKFEMNNLCSHDFHRNLFERIAVAIAFISGSQWWSCWQDGPGSCWQDGGKKKTGQPIWVPLTNLTTNSPFRPFPVANSSKGEMCSYICRRS